MANDKLAEFECIDLTVSDDNEICSAESAPETDNGPNFAQGSDSPFWPAIAVEGNVLGPFEHDILARGLWFNDEIVNGYMNLLARKTGAAGATAVAAVSSFLLPELLGRGRDHPAQVIARHLKHYQLKALRIALFPVNQDGFHWILVVWHVQQGRLRLFDSLKAGKALHNKRLLKQLSAHINHYLESDASVESLLDAMTLADTHGQRYRGVPLIRDAETVQDMPQQMDGSSCGAFTCKFAYNAVNELEQKAFNVSLFRRQMIQDFLSGRNKTHGDG